ncbi:MAG: type II toxin-antitoxin system HicA family toxin [Chloroflexi bacterium]|nr:type II toxin-antitoxin system HicA family toxin [Chloroflexota bacterium]
MRALDRTARPIHQDGSHQKWRLHDGSTVIVPIHSDDIPTGTLRSIERQGEPALGRMWLRKASLHD